MVLRGEKMEVTKIGMDSFKISLSSMEAREYKVEEVDNKEGVILEESFKKLIDKIKESNGINFGKEKSCIEIYVSRDGGCDIFVSKSQVERTNKGNQKSNNRVVYRFANFVDLIQASKRLVSIAYEGDSAVYWDNLSKSYYLILNGIYQRDLKYSFLSEYGFRVKNNAIMYITEHFECLCKNNALEKFSKLL